MTARTVGSPVQLPLAVRWLQAPGFAAFASGGNEEALAAAQAAASGAIREVLLHGGSGSGKTHLLQAAARSAHDQGRRSAYLDLSHCLETTPRALAGFDALDCLCLDAFESVCGSHERETALVRLIDALRSRAGGLVLASRHAPADLLSTTSPDLRTRLSACAIYALRPLPDDALVDALRRQANARGLLLNADAASYLVHRLPRDLPKLISVLDQLDRTSLSTHRRLTIPFVQACLGWSADEAPAPTSG